MKVRKLIEALSLEDGEAEVMFTYNYGDHWNNEVASEINCVDCINVRYSDYHSMYRKFYGGVL